MANALILCDLDGTLANCEHRQHYVRGPGKKNWKAFFDGMSEDQINDRLDHILDTLLDGGYAIVFVSARPDNYRKVTETWLASHGWVVGHNCQLLMRKAGDYREDTIVKQEILNDILADPNNEIVAVFDDRKSVVDMWRRNGLLCLQVADHDF